MGKQTLRPAEWVAGVRELMVRYEIARSGTGDEDTAGMAPRLGAEATTWPSAPVSSPQRAGRDAGALISPPASANGEDASLICALSTRIAGVMKAVRNTACGGDGPAVKGSAPVLSIVHSHHLRDEGGSGRGPAARCDGDGPDRVLTATPKSCRFPACRLSTSWLGNDATFPRLPAPCKRQKSPPLRRPIQTFPERQSLRRSAHAFDAPSFSPS